MIAAGGITGKVRHGEKFKPEKKHWTVYIRGSSPGHWSWRPPKKNELPTSPGHVRKSPIDKLVKQMRELGMSEQDIAEMRERADQAGKQQS